MQDTFTYAKLIALFIIIAFGVYLLAMGKTLLLSSLVYANLSIIDRFAGNVKYFTFEDTKTEVTSLALSFYSGLFAYNGWYVSASHPS